jgi:hypothetical protein
MNSVVTKSVKEFLAVAVEVVIRTRSGIRLIFINNAPT